MKNHFGIGLLTKIMTEKITETAKRLFAAFFVLALVLEPTAMVFAEAADIETASVPVVYDAVVPTDPISVPSLQEPNVSISAFDGITPASDAISDQKPKDDQLIQESQKDVLADVTTPEAQTSAMTTPVSTQEDVLDRRTVNGVAKAEATAGALSSSFTFETPSGRGGLTSDVALAYSSQEKSLDNIYGRGWTDNIPFVQRVNKKGIERMYSEYDFTTSLDGELLPSTNSSTSTFSAKVENGDFHSYIFSDNSWQMTDKQGTVYTFGSSTLSRQDNPGNTSKVYKWMLETIRDTNGNTVRYEYFKDGGQIYPSKISYVEIGGSSVLHEIVFLREPRNDGLKIFSTGFAVSSHERISKIQIKTSGSIVSEYQLTYTSGDNGKSSLLAQIDEVAFDSSHNPTNVLTTKFGYSASTSVGWQQDGSYNISGSISRYDGTRRVQVDDVNGDALPDFLYAHRYETTVSQSTNINQGNGTWLQDANYTIPIPISRFDGPGRALVNDVNGDYLPDFMYYHRYETTSSQGTYLNHGDGTWPQDGNYTLPIPITRFDGPGRALIGDVNGDGLPDFMYNHRYETTSSQGTYINQGNGMWLQDVDYNIPVSITRYDDVYRRILFRDINGDGLPDFLYAHRYQDLVVIKATYINKGDGTGWELDPNYTIPVLISRFDGPSRVLLDDINGDGLPDFMYSHFDGINTSQSTYINKGDGTGWELDPDYVIPGSISRFDGPSRALLDDVNADGLPDFMYAHFDGINTNQSTFINKGKVVDLLTSIQREGGGTTRIDYQSSQLYKDDNNKLLNSHVPFVIQTVKSVAVDDGFGNVATTTYSYAGGSYYFASSTDRKFAGFGQVTETDSVGNVTTTYYHQGNTTDSANGEYDDHISKAGKPYRVEQLDGSGNVYKTTINKWDRTDLGSGRNFVKLAQSTSLDFDGNATHKDSAQTFAYDTATGNLTATTNWGEVSANTGTGSFSDVGNDAVSTNISYAANSSANIYLPSQETTQDQSANKVKETRHYYDGLALGSVSKGNETKTEYWKSGSSYVSTTKTYNSYGLMTQEKDARGNATNYTYDTYNLYPATVSNPLSQTKSFVYNYACGKPTSVTNENGRVFTVTYDGLCRPTEEKQPDLTTPTTLVTKATYVYTDTIGNRNVKKTTYLSSGNSVDEYTYLDGFDRVIQKRKEAEASNTFSVSDIVYDTRGLLQKESLPYFSSGFARTSPTATASLYSTNTYDPLKRAIVIATAVGNTTNTYDDWKVTTTDANGNVKDFVNDAFGNLVRVVEHNGASEYTTAYEYDRLGNLTKITDALGNVRNFTYDGLGRRLTAQDVHAPADGTFGTYTYTYDNAGNMTSRVDPKGQTVTWSYDTLNRPQNENYTGASGTEISYTYDSGTDGKTRLTRAVALGFATTTYAYNPLGQIKTETKTITGTSTSFATNYTYDRAGNQTLITYPDSAQAKYIFNTAGLLEKVQKKEQGEEPFSNVVTNYDYAPTGQPTTIAYANGVVTTNTYDPTALYRTTNKVAILPNGERAQDLAYTYDAIGNITRVVDNSNTLTKKTSNYTYDNLSRLLSATITNASSTNETQTFSYDALGNILAGPLGTYAYAGTGYANPHAMTSITAAASSSSHADIVFDATSNQSGHDVDTLQWSHTTGAEDDRLLVVTTYNDLDTTSVGWITYDDINLSFAQRIDNSGTQMEQWYLINPPEGAHDIVVSYNDIVHAGAIAETYSGVHQSEGPETAISATGIVGADGDNQPSQSIGVTTDKSLVIDGVYELGDTADLIPATEQTERSALTVEGSRMETSGKIQTYAGTTTVSWSGVPDNTPWGIIASVFAPAHIAVSPVSSHFTYDNNGNVTQSGPTTNGGQGTTTYTWDYQNRLTQSGGTATSTYAYDHTGARIKLVEGPSTGSGGATITTYFPNTLYNVTANSTTKHIFAHGSVIATVEKNNGTATLRSITTDHLNGVNIVTDPSGNIVETLDYYPYGTIRTDTKAGSYAGEKRKYIGQEFDTQTQLSYLNARYYNGNTAKFLSQDPVFWEVGQTKDGKMALVNPQAMNSYSYAGNNPIINKDPDGRFWWQGFYDWRGYDGWQGVMMKTSEVFGGHSRALSVIQQNQNTVSEAGAKYGVETSLINAIIYEEQSHLQPDEVLGREQAFPNLGRGGVGVMQVSSHVGKEFGNYTKAELARDSKKNINAGTAYLSSVSNTNSPVVIGKTYNGSISYGQRLGAQMSNQNYNSNIIITGLQQVVSSLQKLISSLKK